MNTSTDACQVAFAIFRDAGGQIDRATINGRLVALGYQGISPRTYTHLAKLNRYGATKYLPINQLDVIVSNGWPIP
jgi:hypothetical protein